MPSVVQVSVSKGGVPKRAVLQALLSREGVEGDSHKHPEFHGGPRQAVLVVTLEGIEELKALGYALYPGALGENITTEGIDRREIRIGSHLRVGEAVLLVTKMREPCNTLSPYGLGIQKEIFDARTKAGDWTSPVWGLAGFYTSVLHAGVARPGDPVVLS